MENKHDLSDELFDILDKNKSKDARINRHGQRNTSSARSVERIPEAFGFNKRKKSDVIIESRVENKRNGTNFRRLNSRGQQNRSNARSVENIPQTFGNSKLKEMVAKHPERSFNEDRKFNSERYARDRISTSERYERGRFSNSERNERERVPGFGFNSLKMMVKKDSTELLMELTCKKKGFYSLLEEKLRPDMIMLVVEILGKISDSPMKENKAALLAHSVRPNVLEMFSTHSCDFVTKDRKYTKAEIINYFQNLAIFYQDFIDILPNTATDHLREHTIKTLMAIQSLKTMKDIHVPTELEQKFNDLHSCVVSMVKSKSSASSKQYKKKDKLEWKPGTDFREISVFPLPQDVLSRSEVQLSPVVIKGPYKSVEHYLDVQFNLMREDFLIPLRDGIMNFIEQNSVKSARLKRIENVRFYKEVKFLSQFVEGDTLVSEVLFDPRGRMRKQNWKRSKRFLYGSLVCFSSDLFGTLFLGIVVNRDVGLLENGILQCELIGDIKEGDLFSKNFTMAESEVYFEAYQHVLKALKIFNETNFPLQEYIINVSCEVSLPSYLSRNYNVTYNFGDHMFRVLDPFSWPSLEQLKVNQSQYKALHSALTQKCVVIQGPPGTGKTYLGLIIAKLLYDNSDHWRQNSRGPILVVCYTNHALDQFLEGILSFTENIVRVGSRSKNEKLDEYNLRVMRRKRDITHFAFSRIEHEIHNCVQDMNGAHAFIKELIKKSGIISLRYLRVGMVSHHCEWFKVKGVFKDELLVEWLLAGAFFQNNSNAEFGILNVESIPEEMIECYACSMIELQGYLIQLKDEMTKTQYDDDVLYLKNVEDLYRNRLLYLKNKLMEPVSEDGSLIIKLQEVHNLNELPHQLRWVLYDYWLSRSIKYFQNILNEGRTDYQMLSKQKLEILDSMNLETMLGSNVVGMTTTGAAKHQTLLQRLGAKIVIVEEAAEVMESHVIVSLSEKCEHLILIGDHKQLRPSPAVYKLAKNYNFDVSLFERMLVNDVPYDTLNIQHRMRPEIADLIIPAIYPSLENHRTVMHYENIVGLKKNLYFITHTNSEQLAIDDTSKKNIYEAQFLIALCRHIVLQGYDPSQVTILTTYTGQMFCLTEERDKYSIIKDVRITVVDNFQGEENDIILLSLVRNNTEGKIGFLSTDNRVCVALSRAKKGLYIMGNIEMLSDKSPLWSKIKGVLEEKKAIGTHLTLQCLNHPSQLTDVSKAEDFRSITEGGCSLMCNTKLYCGHFCKKMCHMMGHESYKCFEVCEKRMCILNHRCKKLCWENCGECMVPIPHKLSCGHTTTLPCHKEPSEYACKELVSVELPECKHTVTKECNIDINAAHCSFPCDTRLPCGHMCEMTCHTKDDPEHLNYKCKKQCGRKNLECKDDHMCQRKCFEECNRCTFKVKRNLPKCDHFYDMECWVDPGSIECHKPCRRMLQCGHKCPLKCVDQCGSCPVVVEKEIPDCKHKIRMKCCKIPERKMCTMKCERMRHCGHICRSVCGLSCNEKKCDALLKECFIAPCEHQVRLFCHEINSVPDGLTLMKRCMEPCSKILECTHRCKGTCGGCLQGRIHVPCQEKCGKDLICGHNCMVSCSQTCPPCKKNCDVKCEHSKCKKKCGAPCIPCKEKCGWKCEHHKCNRLCGELCDRPPCEEPCKEKLECGHPCIGFCGEECPPLCKICNAAEIEDILIFLGTDDDENTRFVLLPDCKHVFDSKGLDKWMAMDESIIRMKECPQCKTPIQRAYRYGNYAKQHFSNVQAVKYKIFGGMRNVKGAVFKASEKLHNVFRTDEFKDSQEYFNQLERLLKQSKNRHLDAFVLNSLEARTQFVLSITDHFKKMKNKINRLMLNKYSNTANMLIKIILKRLDFISPQEHYDIDCECSRFHLFLYLGAVENCDDFKTFLKDKWYDTYEECKKLVCSSKPFRKDLYEYTFTKIDKLHKLLASGIGISKVEMNDIVRAINLHQGHWVRCPNGHVYVIANCGGATQEGVCNECGARIGGTDHQLLPSNRRLDDVPQGF